VNPTLSPIDAQRRGCACAAPRSGGLSFIPLLLAALLPSARRRPSGLRS
jgi:hypothetical protein